MAAKIDIIEEHLSNLIIPQDYLPTLGEVRAAVRNLKTKTSPYNMGLMAETLHLWWITGNKVAT